MVSNDIVRGSSLFRKIKDIQNKIRLSSLYRSHMAVDGKKKLHIGCGGNIYEGWLNVDIEPQSTSVGYLDASKIFPFESDSFDYVFSEHMFEHLDFEGQVSMLRECYRVLRKGGIMRIATPDLGKILTIVVREDAFAIKYRNWYIDTFSNNMKVVLGEAAYSSEVFINTYFYNWGHRFIHSGATLKEMVKKNGFESVIEKNVNESNHKELAGKESYANVITDEFNRFETIVLEAIK